MKTKPCFRRKSLLASIIIALAVMFTVQARANTIALSFTSNDNFVGLFSFERTWGWSFSLSSAVLVTDVGVWDANALGNGTGDGLVSSHEVRIWDNTGVQLALATVPAGTSAPLVDGFRYVPLATSLLLAPGNYVIGMHNQVDAGDLVASGVHGLTTAPEVSYTGERSLTGDGFPSGDFNPNNGPNGYFGPNFQFTTPLSNGVPETGGTMALFLGAIGTLITFRKKFLVRAPKHSSSSRIAGANRRA